MSELRVGTRVLQAGRGAAAPGAPFLAGPTFAAPFHFAGDDRDAQYTYGRYHNPTWTAFERALSELEGGEALVFGSGMAAITAIFATALKPGDVLVIPDDCYYTVRMLVDERLRSIGIDVRSFPTAEFERCAELDGATLVWLESPTNPGLDVCDIAAIAARAHAAGALVAVDNTTATAIGQQPLALGADFSVASDTKALTGHADLVLGHVACADPAWTARLRAYRTQTGGIAGPMEVWLAHRSLATLDVRLERQCANAYAIASLLRQHPAVRAVRYPGLPDDPAHGFAERQMRRFGPVVGFDLTDHAQVNRFFARAQLVTEATSFGGVHTSAERRARWGGDSVSPGFIRLSAGCEDPDDLIDDIAQALDGKGLSSP
jgi:cystathionine gamma-lyase